MPSALRNIITVPFEIVIAELRMLRLLATKYKWGNFQLNGQRRKNLIAILWDCFRVTLIPNRGGNQIDLYFLYRGHINGNNISDYVLETVMNRIRLPYNQFYYNYDPIFTHKSFFCAALRGWGIRTCEQMGNLISQSDGTIEVCYQNENLSLQDYVTKLLEEYPSGISLFAKPFNSACGKGAFAIELNKDSADKILQKIKDSVKGIYIIERKIEMTLGGGGGGISTRQASTPYELLQW